MFGRLHWWNYLGLEDFNCEFSFFKVLWHYSWYVLILEVRSLRSRCQQGFYLLKALGENPPLPLLASGGYQSLLFLDIAMRCSSFCLHLFLLVFALSLYFSLSLFSFSYKDTSYQVWALPNLIWPPLNLAASAKTLFPNMVVVRGTRV